MCIYLFGDGFLTLRGDFVVVRTIVGLDQKIQGTLAKKAGHLSFIYLKSVKEHR